MLHFIPLFVRIRTSENTTHRDVWLLSILFFILMKHEFTRDRIALVSKYIFNNNKTVQLKTSILLLLPPFIRWLKLASLFTCLPTNQLNCFDRYNN